jgi:hypothetical protein
MYANAPPTFLFLFFYLFIYLFCDKFDTYFSILELGIFPPFVRNFPIHCLRETHLKQ